MFNLTSVSQFLNVNANECFFFLIQAFELATGDYLFEPHSGDDYSRDEGI